MYRSTDAGRTWTHIGLREAGQIGAIRVHPTNPDLVYVAALGHAFGPNPERGVFRSDDAGATWRRLNEQRNLRQRAWYYSHIHADPRDANTVYLLNTGFYRSVDGGATFTGIQAPHGDHHALWIDHENPQHLINGNDGGANVSMNGGASWAAQDNQATAQFYHITATTDFPYQLCGAQQDNSTACTASRTTGNGITRTDWYTVGGCESGYIAVRPDHPDISFAGCYGGYLERFDRRTRNERNVMVWPENPMGWGGAAQLRYRFQWTFPIVFSPHDHNVPYASGNVLFRNSNEGQSWTPISPDLTCAWAGSTRWPRA